MPGLQQIQDMLERMLGTYPMPAHDYFWRGKTRDELVATEVFGVPILVPGRPDDSNLLRAMRGDKFGEGSVNRIGIDRLRKIFKDIRVAEADVDVLSAWIGQSCPEADPSKTRSTFAAGAMTLDAPAEATDDTHGRYWRAIDDFFLPNLASAVTRPHVLRVHAFDNVWGPVVAGADLSIWTSFLAQPQNAESFNYIRHHQQRLIQEYYGDSKASLLDSLWKFGGNLLPIDPQSHALPHHTMNGIGDWFSWAPYLDASLRAPDVQPVDVDLARGWQIGIVADGLVRTDEDRPEGQRMPIPDFTAADPDLRSKVFSKYTDMDGPLIGEMFRRARDLGIFGSPPVA
jgi:hypothetical protein